MRNLALWIVAISVAVAQVSIERIPVVPLYQNGSKLCDAIVVEDEIVLVGGEGVVLRSKGDFAHWKHQRLKPTEYRTIYSIAKLNKDVWVVVGERGLCYRTLDGGHTWQRIQLPVEETLYRVRVAGNNVLLAVGAKGVVLRSFDQGIMWQRQNSGTQRDLYSIATVGDTAIAVGEDGVVIRSTNRGVTWEVVREKDGLNRSLYDIAAADHQRWYAVGAEKVLVRSTDGGTSWGTKLVGESVWGLMSLRGIWFQNATQGWIVGESSAALEQPIWETTDGGTTWKAVPARIDTPEVNSIIGWEPYPIKWWGIRKVGNQRIVYGERGQCSIIGVEPPDGGKEWERRVWDRLISLALVPGVRLNGCNQMLVLLGYPPAPQVVRYSVTERTWDTVSLLPFIDVVRKKPLPQFRYRGEQPWRWLWNGDAIFVSSLYNHGWRSEDRGNTWHVVTLDTVYYMRNVVPYGERGFAVQCSKKVAEHQYVNVWLGSKGIGDPWKEIFRLDSGAASSLFLQDPAAWRAIVDQGNAIYLWSSSDQGKTWEKQRIIDTNYVHYTGVGVWFVDALDSRIYDAQYMDLLVQVGLNEGKGLDLLLLSTSDGGKTWETRVVMSKLLGRTLQATPAASIVAHTVQDKIIGIGGDIAPGDLIYTRDGKTWHHLVLPKPGQMRFVWDYNGECAVVWRGGSLFTVFNVAPHHLLLVSFGVSSVRETEERVKRVGIAAYPNPASEVLQLRYRESIAPAVERVELYQADGRKIAQFTGAVPHLSVRSLPAGSYYVVVYLRSGEQHLIGFQVVR